MPVSFFEGIRPAEREQLTRRNMERRFFALASAVREHEARVRESGIEPGPEDDALYRRLRQLCGEPTTAEHTAA